MERLEAPLATALAAFAVVAALAFADGGYFPRAWVAGGIALAALAALPVVLRGRLELSRAQAAFPAGLTALAGWVALSALWSDDPSSSLREGGRTLVYVAAAAAFVQLAAHGVLGGVLAATAAACVYGLFAQLVVDPLEIDPVQGGVLFEPVGYANAMGLLAALGLVLVCGLLARAPSRLERAAVAGAAPFLAGSLVLSQSRGAWIALAAGLAVSLALDRATGAAAVLLAPGVAAAAALATVWRPPVTEASAGSAAEARLLGVALLLLALASAALAARVRPPERAGRLALVGLAAAAALALVAVAAGWSPGLGNRLDYWAVAWDEYRANPWLGSGAGTFELYWLRALPVAEVVRDAHSLYVESLAELGPLGLVLVLAALAVPLIGGRAARGPVGAAAVGAYVVFLVHAGLDWDWELPAVTVAGLASGAALLEHAARDGPLRRLKREKDQLQEEDRP